MLLYFIFMVLEKLGGELITKGEHIDRDFPGEMITV